MLLQSCYLEVPWSAAALSFLLIIVRGTIVRILKLMVTL
jgi:hypothetical protein